ncbi:MAG: glutamate--tRNA ligase [Bacteroidetes bacterium HGW-Bacteroidetes-17]|jgi:glutamyl-tRNA synthetase|nr:MAG: glutamate--tRNA ligase [Bacteroidetes bacterium HGW-Bacteroidetes-17]
MINRVRVRFAPSPTGPLHIGGVRTAIFNYLFAKKNGGDFILRIEDTDQNRYVPGAEEYIIQALHWLGIDPNEGIEQGGEFGPYRQSERKPIYKKYAEQLIQDGYAYYAFDTSEELDQMRERLKIEKNPIQQYNAITRIDMKNSLTLSAQIVSQKLADKEPYVIRLKLPDDEVITFNDTVLGEFNFHSSQLDDKILFKSDGMPTYHLANVVDDYLMQITHVIRGSEWTNSTPSHILLYKYLGWEKEMPFFSHMPLILRPDGKGKLSKRDGDRLGFPVFPIEWINLDTKEKYLGYREVGYFPEAFLNFLVLLGWNPGINQEIFTKEELIQLFSLDRIGKSGSKFDLEKAKWFNHRYLQQKSSKEIASVFSLILEEKGIKSVDFPVLKIIDLVKDRATFISDFWELTHYFFIAPNNYDPQIIKKRWKEDTPQMLEGIVQLLLNIKELNPITLESAIKLFIEEKQYNMGQVLNTIRLSLVGSSQGPSVFEIASILTADETVRRIKKAIQQIK